MVQATSTASLGQRKAKTRCRVGLFLSALLLCFGLSAVAQQGGSSAKNPLTSLLNKTSPPSDQSKAPEPAAPAEPAEPTAIPLPEVAAQAEELSRLLRDLGNQLPTREQLEALKAKVDQRDATLTAKQAEFEAMLAGSPSALEVREQETYWYAATNEGAATRRQLLDWANTAQSAVQQLTALQPQWKATLEEYHSTPDLGPTLDVIRDSVKSIQTTKTQAQELLRVIVNLQVTAANQHQMALEALDHLAKLREHLKSRVLQRDSLPLWQVFLRRQQGESPDFYHTANARVISIESFARENRGTFLALAIVFLLSLFGTYRLSIATRGIQPEGELQAQALEVVRHWFALGLLPPLVLAFLLAAQAPLALVGIAILLSFVSILLLLPPLIGPRFRLPLYCLVGVYLFNALLTWMALSPAAKREALFFGSLLAIAVFAYLLRPGRIARVERSGGRHGLLLLSARSTLVVLALAQVANVFGYYMLTQFLTVVCVYSTFIALVAFAALRVFTVLLLAALAAPAAERLAVVRLHRPGIARWAPRVLKTTACLVWLGTTLELLGARARVNQLLADLFDFNIAGTASNITLGSVLAFWAILLGGFALSNALRFLLREELLKRLLLKRGIPELISTTLHYLILLLVFLFAVNAGGVALNKFTVITGALGVGVGFGLQNVINNFVSGLILQFERPIRVNDVLEVDTTTGTVTRIGIRSSTIQTFQGAEVIIPNANFISGKVINWTLSEAKRRLEFPVGVAYGTDPKLVKELLERPAIQHPDVLTSPEPEAFFMGFGDSALNFELRFWVMQDSNTVKVKSEVALEVMRLLDEAGIEIPFPQRDLHVRAVSAEAAALLAHNGSQDSRELEIEQRAKTRTVGER